jgi:hypothetical protein
MYQSFHKKPILICQIYKKNWHYLLFSRICVFLHSLQIYDYYEKDLSIRFDLLSRRIQKHDMGTAFMVFDNFEGFLTFCRIESFLFPTHPLRKN